MATLAIVGLPGSGKTTLAKSIGNALGIQVVHTDAFKNMPWSAQPDAAMLALPKVSYILEGVTVARLFRRGFKPDCVVHIQGGNAVTSMAALIKRGLSEYRGRVVTLPSRPSLKAALLALGGAQ